MNKQKRRYHFRISKFKSREKLYRVQYGDGSKKQILILVGNNVNFFPTFMEGNLVMYKRDIRIFIIFIQRIQVLEVPS